MSRIFQVLFVFCSYAPLSASDYQSLKFVDQGVSTFDVGLSDEIQFGKYLEPYPSPFVRVEISDWAGEILITGFATYGDNAFSFEGELYFEDDKYKGDGKLKVDYSGGPYCRYDLEFFITAAEDKVFLKVNAPLSIKTSIPIEAEDCPEVKNQMYRVKKPFQLIK